MWDVLNVNDSSIIITYMIQCTYGHYHQSACSGVIQNVVYITSVHIYDII